MSKTTYTFAGITFTRVIEGSDFQPWFFPETLYTTDTVLGGTQVYADIGSDSVALLTIRGSCVSDVNRQSLKNARNTTGTLSNSRTRTATVTLVKAQPIDSEDYTLRLIDLTFILRP